jgi:hypothetical protein
VIKNLFCLDANIKNQNGKTNFLNKHELIMGRQNWAQLQLQKLYFFQIIMNVSNFSLKTQTYESENALSENVLAQLLRSYDNNTVLFRDKVLWVG